MTQVLQLATAINSFIVGCKADGIWDPIKACCIMGGWDGLSGALYPLKGAAPTNFNFVSGDYNRKTGLVGNGSTKYLDSNRQNAAEPQNSRHQAVFVSTGPSIAGVAAYIGGGGLGYTGVLNTADTPSNLVCYASNDVTGVFVSAQGGTTGFKGVVRNNSTQASVRSGGSTTSASNTSAAENTSRDVAVFAQVYNTVEYHSSARLAFYSIGESLNLALLDARVTTLITAFGTAIP